VRLALNTFRRAPALRAWLASVLALAFGLSALMAASHTLHEAVHEDADEQGHQCAATLLSRENVLPADIAPAVVVPPCPVSVRYDGGSCPILATVEFLLSPPRGPPVLS
jgi:disulfide bond formation protein DsbB